MGLGSKNIKTNDKIVRAKLIHNLKQSQEISGVMEEFDIVRGKARADVVAISKNKIHAYEIKSDVDTLRRLPSQIRHYNQIFSTVTLVVGSEHAVRAMYLIPDWWGVVVAQVSEGDLMLVQVRDPKENGQINYDSISDLLRREELVGLLNQYATGNGYGSMSKVKLIDEARKEIADELFINGLSSALLSRTG